MHITFQIIIAALSVLGLFLCLKTLASLIFTSKQIAATVIIEAKEQLRDLDILIPEASGALFTARRRRLAVIVPKSIWNACNEKEKNCAEEITDSFGAKLYFVSAIDS
jgi:hypothetical protein